ARRGLTPPARQEGSTEDRLKAELRTQTRRVAGPEKWGAGGASVRSFSPSGRLLPKTFRGPGLCPLRREGRRGGRSLKNWHPWHPWPGAARVGADMTQRIVIDPVTRIEGHAKITIHLGDDGLVSHARFHVTEF